MSNTMSAIYRLSRTPGPTLRKRLLSLRSSCCDSLHSVSAGQRVLVVEDLLPAVVFYIQGLNYDTIFPPDCRENDGYVGVYPCRESDS